MMMSRCKPFWAAFALATALLPAACNAQILVEANSDPFVDISMEAFGGAKAVTYTVPDATQPYVSADGGSAVRFNVYANRPYIIQVLFPAWVPSNSPQGRAQAVFETDGVRIGGVIWLRGRPQRLTWDPNRRRGLYYMSPNAAPTGTILAFGISSREEWAIGADIWPQYTDAASGLAPPGTYSIDAVIQITSFP